MLRSLGIVDVATRTREMRAKAEVEPAPAPLLPDAGPPTGATDISDLDDEPHRLTTLDMIGGGHVYMNEHPRRRPRKASATTGPSLSSVTGGLPPPATGAHLSTTRLQKSSAPTSTALTEGAATLSQIVMAGTGQSGMPGASSCCNIDHDNDMVRRVIAAYARRTQKARQQGKNSLDEATGPTADLFMRSVMSVSKHNPVPPTDPARPSQGMGMVPTRIPACHWVVRETLYDAPRSGRENASVFADLREHKRALVFPSAAPNNRPEVYLLAQTLDLMLEQVGPSVAALASSADCYRILSDDPSIEGGPHEADEAVPPACTRYYRAGVDVWAVIDAGLTEIARQTAPICGERAALVEALRVVAHDVSSTALEVMQFCKEEVRALLVQNQSHRAEVEANESETARLRAEIAELRQALQARDEEREDLLRAADRLKAVNDHVTTGVALMVRDRRLPDLLTIMGNQTATAAANALPLIDHPESLLDNPHLALLAAGVTGIDADAVRALLGDMAHAQAQRAEATQAITDAAESSGAADGTAGARQTSNGGPDDGVIGDDLYREAVRHLLMLDEAVHAIDGACEPFYQQSIFGTPALNTSVAAGKWRAIAKAIGRHEMILEQRERQWKEALTKLRRQEQGTAASTGLGGGGSETLSVSVASFMDSHGGSNVFSEGSVLEQQLGFMRAFRRQTRDVIADTLGPEKAERRGAQPTGAAQTLSPSSAPHRVADAARAAEEFLSPRFLLPPCYSIGHHGVTSMLRDTRAVMVEIVQRLCALATSAQLHALAAPPMLPPSEPDIPCPLCSRIHTAETQRKRRDEAMVRLAEEAAKAQAELKGQILAARSDADEANIRVAQSLRRAAEAESKNTALEKRGVQLLQEVQTLREQLTLMRSGSVLFNPLSPVPGGPLGFGMDDFGDAIIEEPADADGDLDGTRGGGDPVVINLVINCSCCAGGTIPPPLGTGFFAPVPGGMPVAAGGGGGALATTSGAAAGAGAGIGSKPMPTYEEAAALLAAVAVTQATLSGAGSPAQSPVTGQPAGTSTLGKPSATTDGKKSRTPAGAGFGMSPEQLFANFNRQRDVPIGTIEAGEHVPGVSDLNLFDDADAENWNASESDFADPALWNAVAARYIHRELPELVQAQSAQPAQPKPQGAAAATTAGVESTEAAVPIGTGEVKTVIVSDSHTIKGEPLREGACDQTDASAGGRRTHVAEAAAGCADQHAPTGRDGHHPTATSSASGLNMAGVAADVNGAGGVPPDGPGLPNDTPAGDGPRRPQPPSAAAASAPPSHRPRRGSAQPTDKVTLADTVGATRRDPEGAPPGSGRKAATATKPTASEVTAQITASTSGLAAVVAPVPPPRPRIVSDDPYLAEKHEGVFYPKLRNATVAHMCEARHRSAAGTMSQLCSALGASAATRCQKSLAWLLRLVAQFYRSKLLSDLLEVRKASPLAGTRPIGGSRPTTARQQLLSAPNHLGNMLKNMFGAKTVVDGNLAELVLCCSRYYRVDPRVSQFVTFLADTQLDAQSLFFYTRLSRATDNCTVGLQYCTSTAAFCHDEEPGTLQIISLSRIRGILMQTQLVRKPYSAALWDLVCECATQESSADFRTALLRAGIKLLQNEPFPKSWTADEVKRGRMTCPKIIFVSAATHFEAVLRTKLGEASLKTLPQQLDDLPVRQ